MTKFLLASLFIFGLSLAEPSFLGSYDLIVDEASNGDSRLSLESVKNVGGECIEDLVRIDYLVELLSEFFVSETHDVKKLQFLHGGFTSIRDSCVSEFSSPDLMDCSNDIEGITQKIVEILSILINNPNGDFQGLDPDSLSRAKETCIIPVADDICEHQLDASLEDTAVLVRDVYGLDDVSAVQILEDANDAARELKTLVFACDNAVETNDVFEAVRDAILRVLLVVEACHDEFKEDGTICETIDGDELADLVDLFQEYGVIEGPEEGEDSEEGEASDDDDGSDSDLVRAEGTISVETVLIAQE